VKKPEKLTKAGKKAAAAAALAGVSEPPAPAPSVPSTLDYAADSSASLVASTAKPILPPIDESDDMDKRSVILFNLPLDFTDKQLQVRLRKLQRKIVSVEREGRRARLVFENAGAAHAVCQDLDKREWGGGVVFARRPQQMATQLSAMGRCRLIVRNLGFKVTDDQLRQLFEQYGPLYEAAITKENGKSKGFGFVQYVCRPDAVRAVEKLNGDFTLGPPKTKTPIAIDFALTKTRYEQIKKLGGADAGEDDDDEGDGDKKAEEDTRDEEQVAQANNEEEAEGGEEEEEDDDAEEDGGSDDEKEDNDEEEEDDDEDEKQKAKDAKTPVVAKPTADSGVAQQRTLFVQNLLFETTEDAIRARFREFGPVRGIKLVKDTVSGRSRGTAFVEFWEAATAAKVCPPPCTFRSLPMHHPQLTCLVFLYKTRPLQTALQCSWKADPCTFLWRLTRPRLSV